MISFCDIPITRANDFRKYGKYAIGMERTWGISKGINPITYIASDNISKAYSTILDVLQFTSEQARINVLKNFLRGISSLIEMGMREKKEVADEDVLKLYRKEKPNINMVRLFTNMGNTLIGYIKPYESEHSKHGRVINYNDNEWRYIVPPAKDHKWLHGEKEYAEWRGNSKLKPVSTFDALDFEIDDIRYIIVDKEADAQKLIADIAKMKPIGGRKYEGKDDLSSRKLNMIKNIISIERLDEDF